MPLPSYRMPAPNPPAWFNQEALVGGLIGLATLNPLIALTGAGIGAYVGHRQDEREQRDGVVVNPPSYWTKETLIGGLMGFSAAGLMGLFLGISLTGIGLMLGAPTLGFFGFLGGAMATIAGGLYYGAQCGHRHGQMQYELAKQVGVEIPPSPLMPGKTERVQESSQDIDLAPERTTPEITPRQPRPRDPTARVDGEPLPGNLTPRPRAADAVVDAPRPAPRPSLFPKRDPDPPESYVSRPHEPLARPMGPRKRLGTPHQPSTAEGAESHGDYVREELARREAFDHGSAVDR